MKLKITQVADYFDARTGNPLAVFARLLSERGHDVTVLASRISEKPGMLSDETTGAKIERFSAIKIGTKAIFPELIPRILFAKDIGIVHAHVLGFYSLFVCAALKKVKGYKLVITPDFDVKNPIAGFPKNFLSWLTMKFPLQQADLILPFTEMEKQELHSRFGIALEKMRVLPIGIETGMFSRKQQRDYRKELGLEKKFILFSASFLSKKKNIETILAALLDLPEQVVFVHAGGATDIEYKKELEKFVQENALQDRVFFLGNKTVTEIAQAYKCTDVFVQAGFRESYCIPIIEAMAAGLPVITTMVGVAGEAIVEGKNGFFASNEKEIALAVKRLLSDKVLSAKISTENLEKARQFDWKEIIEKLEQNYQSLL